MADDYFDRFADVNSGLDEGLWFDGYNYSSKSDDDKSR